MGASDDLSHVVGAAPAAKVAGVEDWSCSVQSMSSTHANIFGSNYALICRQGNAFGAQLVASMGLSDDGPSECESDDKKKSTGINDANYAVS